MHLGGPSVGWYSLEECLEEAQGCKLMLLDCAALREINKTPEAEILIAWDSKTSLAEKLLSKLSRNKRLDIVRLAAVLGDNLGVTDKYQLSYLGRQDGTISVLKPAKQSVGPGRVGVCVELRGLDQGGELDAQLKTLDEISEGRECDYVAKLAAPHCDHPGFLVDSVAKEGRLSASEAYDAEYDICLDQHCTITKL